MTNETKSGPAQSAGPNRLAIAKAIDPDAMWGVPVETGSDANERILRALKRADDLIALWPHPTPSPATQPQPDSKEGETHACLTCCGDGYINEQAYYHNEPCPDCNGTGRGPADDPDIDGTPLTARVDAPAVAWTNEMQLRFLKEYPGNPMAMWAEESPKSPIPLYAAPPADAVRALRKARDAIASLPAYVLGGASVEHADGSGELYQYPLGFELLAEIYAALPPDAGSRK